VAVFYDRNWRAKYVTDAASIAAVAKIIAQTQVYYKWPSLTSPITFNVVSVTFQNVDLPANGTGL